MTKMVKREVPNAIDYPKEDTFSYLYYVLNKCWKDFKDSGLFYNTWPGFDASRDPHLRCHLLEIRRVLEKTTTTTLQCFLNIKHCTWLLVLIEPYAHVLDRGEVGTKHMQYIDDPYLEQISLQT